MGTMLRYGSEAPKPFTKVTVVPEFSRAHEEGDSIFTTWTFSR
jgi:hypothetical protein